MNLPGVTKVGIKLGFFFVIYWFGVPNWASSVAARARRRGAKPPKMTFLSSPVRKRSCGDTVASPGCRPIDEAAAWGAHATANGCPRERHANVTQVSSLTHQARCCASWRTRQRAADCHDDTGRHDIKKKKKSKSNVEMTWNARRNSDRPCQYEMRLFVLNKSNKSFEKTIIYGNGKHLAVFFFLPGIKDLNKHISHILNYFLSLCVCVMPVKLRVNTCFIIYAFCKPLWAFGLVYMCKNIYFKCLIMHILQ